MYFWDETQMEFLVTCVCSSSSVEGVVLLLYIGSIVRGLWDGLNMVLVFECIFIPVEFSYTIFEVIGLDIIIIFYM